jgi:putative tryptophan/tyrosine transport system substrate-binding protein
VNRRTFITLLGGAAAWPLPVGAQQAKVVRLGYLEPQTPTDLVAANLRRQFVLGLRDLGYVERRHFTMEDRSADGRLDRLPALASELAGCRSTCSWSAARRLFALPCRRATKSRS